MHEFSRSIRFRSSELELIRLNRPKSLIALACNLKVIIKLTFPLLLLTSGLEITDGLLADIFSSDIKPWKSILKPRNI